MPLYLVLLNHLGVSKTQMFCQPGKRSVLTVRLRFYLPMAQYQPGFHRVNAPDRQHLDKLLNRIIARVMRRLLSATESPFRRAVVPASANPSRNKSKKPTIQPSTETAVDQALHCSPLSWAERLKRGFDIDISVCPLCGGKGRVKGHKTISLPLSDG